MPTDTTVNALVINKLTKAQYDEIQNPSETELYLVPDEIDNVPTSGSDNPVKSGGVYTALGGKQDTIDSSHKLSADLVDDSSSTNKFTNTTEKTTWNGKQAKITATGILICDGIGHVSAALKQDIVDLGIPGTDTNTTYKLKIGSTTNGDSVNGVDLGTLENKAAASGGTDLSLVTTGEKYAWNNKASLDENGKVPSSQLPSYVDDVLEYATLSAFPATGESGKIYVDLSTNRTYRWGGTQYTPIKGDLVIGSTTGTAADGGVVNTHINDNTIHVTSTEKQTWNNKVDNTTTVNGHALSGNVTVTASDVGLGNVTNDAQVKGLPSGTTVDHVVVFGNDGYTIKDSGKTIGKSVPSDAVFTDTTYTLGVGSGANADKIVLTPSSGNADAITVPYATNAGTVNGHTVNSDVPANAVFTDTNTWRPLGTGATDACAGNDSRLSDARVASNMIADYTEVSSNTSGVTTSLTQDGSETKVYYNSGNAAVTVSFATSGLVFTDGNDSMEIPAGGYGEVNFLRVTTGNTTRVFVRSIVSE